MSSEITPNTQAILLLTAPLRQGRADDAVKPLSVGEYRFLVRLLIVKGKEPADLLGSDAAELLRAAGEKLDSERLERLLARGFLLAQSLERWRARSIWVVSRADAQYPTRIKRRLRDSAPPVLYGCGDPGILETGGLAVVGSRAADDSLLTYAEDVGKLTAEAGITVVSGGARGIDSAAMKGAAAAGGRVVGVLADKLEGAVVNRENRAHLMAGRLALISPYDPSAGFNVGHAMQRNKLIYALADAGLVVSADLEKGGTWAGAVEQLERLQYVPVFVRSAEQGSAGLDGLMAHGGLPWSAPSSAEELRVLVAQLERKSGAHHPKEQLSSVVAEGAFSYNINPSSAPVVLDSNGKTAELKKKAQAATQSDLKELFSSPSKSLSAEEIMELLNITKKDATAWLRQLVQEGVIEKQSRPVRYRAAEPNRALAL